MAFSGSALHLVSSPNAANKPIFSARRVYIRPLIKTLGLFSPSSSSQPSHLPVRTCCTSINSMSDLDLDLDLCLVHRPAEEVEVDMEGGEAQVEVGAHLRHGDDVIAPVEVGVEHLQGE